MRRRCVCVLALLCMFYSRAACACVCVACLLVDPAGCVACRGEDDEQIQYVMLQAEQGNVNSMISLGSLLYYGTRGVARNQRAAYRWCEPCPLFVFMHVHGVFAARAWV